MSQYRLQPAADRRWWWSLFGVSTVILLLPSLVLPFVPTRAVSDEVYLGVDGGWSVPLDRECRPSSEAISAGWNCGSVLVQTMIVEGGTDPDRTLRRMMRAMLYIPVADDAEILREGEARMLIDDWSRSVGVSLEGTGEREGQTLVGVFTGPGEQVVPLVDDTWQEFTGRELPEIVQEAIAGSRAGDGVGGGVRIPLELTPAVAA